MFRISFICGLFIFFSCQESLEPKPLPVSNFSFARDTCIVNNSGWVLPISDIIDAGVGKDGIPSLDNPEFISANDALYLNDTDLIIGVKTAKGYRAYPHKILDKHEIVNDMIDGKAMSITFCPLTGTGIGFERNIDSIITTFGVSGLLYNSNLIMYDRLTNSHWSQFGMRGLEGEFACQERNTFQVIETSWKNWKTMFPTTLVLSNNTGFNLPYDQIAFSGIVNENSSLPFPVVPFDKRLSKHTRAHGIIFNGEAKAYLLSHFSDKVGLIQENIPGISSPIVVIGNMSRNFIISYISTLENGTFLEFTPIDDNSKIIMKDQLGNKWDLWGLAVEGPNQGSQLTPTLSLMGYWFAWGAFYPDLDIYDGLSTKDE